MVGYAVEPLAPGRMVRNMPDSVLVMQPATFKKNTGEVEPTGAGSVFTAGFILEGRPVYGGGSTASAKGEDTSYMVPFWLNALMKHNQLTEPKWFLLEENDMKKNAAAFSIRVAAVLLLLAIASPLCMAGELLGTWSAENADLFGEKGSIRVVFAKDGTVSFDLRLKSRKSEEIFNYRLENGTLYVFALDEIFDPEEAAEIYFQFIGDKLRLDIDESMGTLLLDRVGQAPQPESRPAPLPPPEKKTPVPPTAPAGGTLAGTWTSGSLPGNRSISFVFSPSGTVEITAVTGGKGNTNRASFKEEESRIRIINDAGRELSIPRRWRGDTLILTVDGEEIALTREGATGGDEEEDDNPWF